MKRRVRLRLRRSGRIAMSIIMNLTTRRATVTKVPLQVPVPVPVQVRMDKARTTAEIYHHRTGMMWTGMWCRDITALELCSACLVDYVMKSQPGFRC
ncbi:hypothetical protein SMACR_02937 [Sordaria macrospora]|uniref:Uncharacterized protein n=1 Tax=Sordaria macrospora TaxID=5147 RepID=A0A8S9A250_SORMA|nr:hypothetical protein SMACR_02937 [Sordaria macrospora]WPJ58297.1 hypothetical protein SMAC4_02937 [Sordaria macrospora]